MLRSATGEGDEKRQEACVSKFREGEKQREGERERERERGGGRNEGETRIARVARVESEVFECIVGRSQRRNMLFVQQCGYVHRGLDVNGMTFRFLKFFPLDIYT